MKDLIYPGIRQNFYKIDEYGNIYSSYKHDFMSPSKDKDGYLKISLRGSEVSAKTVRIAKLVAYSYLGPSKDLVDPTVNHKDGNILNNHYSNLEWMERQINTSIRFKRGEGATNSQAKLTTNDVKEICELLINTNLTCPQIAKKFNVSPSAIRSIVDKKTWKNISYCYDFSCRKYTRDSFGKFTTINLNLIKEKTNGN